MSNHILRLYTVKGKFPESISGRRMHVSAVGFVESIPRGELYLKRGNYEPSQAIASAARSLLQDLQKPPSLITFYQIYVILRNNEKNRLNFSFILPITRIMGAPQSRLVCLS